MAIGGGSIIRDVIKPSKPPRSLKRACFKAADLIGTLCLLAVGIGVFAAVAWGLSGLLAELAKAVMR